MKRILLTGAYGNIGINTLEELLVRGFDVITFDIPRRKNRRLFRKFKKKWLDRIDALWGDLRNYYDVEKAVKDIDAVIHLGAIIPPLSEINPDQAYEVNVGGTINIIKVKEIE